MKAVAILLLTVLVCSCAPNDLRQAIEDRTIEEMRERCDEGDDEACKWLKKHE